MANDLGNYNPEFFASEALIQLEKSLGMAARVHRRFEGERNGRGMEQGDTINIKRPGSFIVNDAPSAAQDVLTDKVAITLNQWKEVKIGLTDQEIAYTGDEIIEQHIRPMAVALAEKIDLDLLTLHKGVANFRDLNALGSVDTSDITNVRETLVNAQAPVMAQPNNMFYGFDPRLENEFLQLPDFSQQQGAGDRGVNTQVTASLGRKFGFDMFSSQNIPLFTGGVNPTGTILVNGAVAARDEVINIDGVAGGGDILEGDIITITDVNGDPQNYVATANVSNAAAMAIPIAPKARTAIADNTAVTIKDQNTTPKKQNLAFHRDAFALVFAPLPDSANMLPGTRVATISDPLSNLSLRFRHFYEGNNSKMFIALDALYGLEVLNPDLAVRAIQ